jgi:hypothetical protein
LAHIAEISLVLWSRLLRTLREINHGIIDWAEKGLDVYVSDPILSRHEVEGKGLRFIKSEESDRVFAPIELNFNSTGEVR